MDIHEIKPIPRAKPAPRSGHKKALLAGGLCALTGLCVWGVCATQRSSRQLAADSAIYLMSVAEPATSNIRIISTSEADSVLDYRFFSQSDASEMLDIMDYLSSVTMNIYNSSDAESMNQAEMEELAEASSKSSAAIQAMMRQSFLPDPEGKLTGWKVKVIYDYTGQNGHTQRAQRWFYIDSSGSHAVKSFDFPYIPASK